MSSAIEETSTPTEAAAANHLLSGRGRNAWIRPVASGTKTRIVSVILLRAPDQEVEEQAADSEQEQERVRAQVARLDRARDRRARAHDASRAAHDRALHEVGLDHTPAEAAERAHRVDEDGVVEVIEVPLV